MAVIGWAGKKGATHSIDYYRDGKRIREAVGPNKKDAQEVLGQRLKEIRNGKPFGIRKREEVLITDFCDTGEDRASHRRPCPFGYNLGIFKAQFSWKHLHEIAEKDIDDFILVRRDTPTKRGTRSAPGIRSTGR